MSEPASGRPPQERRHADRRAEPDATRRAPPPSRWARWMGIAGRDLAIIVVCLAAIIVSVRTMNPIFSGQPTVAASITRTLPIAKAAVKVPQDSLAKLTSTPQFEKDRQAFAADLVKTGRMSQAR